MEIVVFLANLIPTAFLTGLIWVVQLTQYPSFHWFDEAEFIKNHDAYRLRIAIVAAPAMLVEMAASVLLLFYRPAYVGQTGAWLGLTLTLGIWLSMFFLQVPLHERLAKGFDSKAAERLIKSNWIRTVAWTVRCALFSLWTYRAMSS